MTIGERVKKVRSDKGLTMEQFGARLGIGKSAVSMIEKGTNIPSDQTIISISREFLVSEEWLRTGEGEQTPELTTEQEMARLVAQALKAEDSDFRIRIMKAVNDLPPEGLKQIEDFCRKILDEKKPPQE